MTAPDAPEPLHMTLAEALDAVRMVEPHTFHLTHYGTQWRVEEDKRKAVREVVDRDEAWPALLSRFFGHPVVERDDTAELVEALERVTRGALWDDLVDRWLVQPEAMERVRAALARHREAR